MANIPHSKARQIIRTALVKGRELELKPLSVAVLDAGGNLIAFERTDGASAGRFQIAHGKAYGAIMLGMGGRAQMDRAETQAYFMLAANGAYGGAVIPVPGGVLVRNARGALLGAVGVTGDTSENDEICAIAAIEAAGYTPQP